MEAQLESTLKALKRFEEGDPEYVELLSRLNDKLTEYLYGLGEEWV